MRQAVRAIVLKGNNLLVMKRNKFGQEYYTLIGGGIDRGEDATTALTREVTEETGVQLGRTQLVYVEDAGPMYGVQYVFWCEYVGGEPALQPNCEEAIISAMGQNTYEPMWVPTAELSKLPFRSDSLKTALLDALKHGFPNTPQQLVWDGTSTQTPLPGSA